jgi:hypothetical protein
LRALGGRYCITLCPRCGQFHVYGEKDGVHYEVKFTLCTDELLEAAGQYVRFLEAQKHGADKSEAEIPELPPFNPPPIKFLTEWED